MAKLYAADLSMAKLYAADLSAADLRYTNLTGANLQGAGFEAAYLDRTNLQGANLGGAFLNPPPSYSEVPPAANLTEAKADDYTTWPVGFDPVAAGVIFE